MHTRIGIALPVVLLAACSQPTPPVSTAVPAAEAPFSTTLDVKQLMEWVMETNADVVFAAVGTIITASGEEHIAPKSDEAWNTVRNSLAVVLESGNLLMLPGRARDQGDWIERSKALSAAAGEVMKAIDVKDSESFFVAAGNLYETCTDCHEQYIYGGVPESVTRPK